MGGERGVGCGPAGSMQLTSDRLGIVHFYPFEVAFVPQG